MDVTSASSNFAAQAPGATAPAASGNAISSDFETFIKMLTTQMQNQDPLNPIESADFAVQLATFSTVEQQVKTNDLLSSLADRIGGLGVSQLSGWIGMTARAQMPVSFNGAPVSLSVEAPAQADEAELVVRNAHGKEMQRLSVPAESGPLTWAGVDATGAPLPAGTYAISLDAYKDGNLLSSTPAETQGRIVEARNARGETILVMAGGQEVAASAISGLRESGS